MAKNSVGKYLKSNSRRWSVSAIDCYNLGCNCSKRHIISPDMKGKCRMKATVLELVRLLGKPKEKPLSEEEEMHEYKNWEESYNEFQAEFYDENF